MNIWLTGTMWVTWRRVGAMAAGCPRGCIGSSARICGHARIGGGWDGRRGEDFEQVRELWKADWRDVRVF